ncbi:MAG: hypothetical protein WCY97_00610 [Methanothrix sp.]|jgi:hypothetical protein|uniref:Uncharacterized protein n=1 Tax=Methanothrix harundinacea TaxID=301375 RepID=A0A124FMN9_9EURY|nr:MAG: hypothetical protein APR56_09880 [Methanosaeta sp. SDB]KUK45357.1 MAG: Uncharacterized protein XD72_0260 [Methanothrix harundinacea]MDD3709228.1 hypothetical protein [Methanothrix sp.]MDI9399645.1 hypothetical protein [Euryarchaeota archaeon]KUK97723.1 MAG: Uncharacterized protein XE07_0137 [Methanothrix harundinacea]
MKRRSIAIFLLIFFYLLGSVQAAEGPGGPSGSSGGGGESSSSSGGRKIVKLDLEDLIGNLEKWKQDDPSNYEYLKKLLHIPFVPPKDYAAPTVYLWYPSGKTNITRNDKLDIYAYVKNDNPIEVRSDVYLWLEAKGPGEEEFTRVGSQRVILANEYSEKNNVTTRDWSGMTPFVDSKAIGNATFRIWFNDMHSTYYTDTMYSNPYNRGEYHSLLELDLVNSPPEVDEGSIGVEPARARYNDPIRYLSRFVDTDGDMINVTIHVLDDQKGELRNETQYVKSGTNVTFIASEYGFFGEGDAGKNFSYRYTYGDGLNSIITEIFPGPTLLPSPKIFVSDPHVEAADENRYWWQNYRFSLKAKNPEMNNLRIDLYTSTPSHPNRYQDTRVINSSDEAQDVLFDIKPFDVSDANESFTYSFKYSATDQNSREETGDLSGGSINPKIVRYPIYSMVTIGNLLAVILAALVGGIVIERRLYQ